MILLIYCFVQINKQTFHIIRIVILYSYNFELSVYIIFSFFGQISISQSPRQKPFWESVGFRITGESVIQSLYDFSEKCKSKICRFERLYNILIQFVFPKILYYKNYLYNQVSFLINKYKICLQFVRPEYYFSERYLSIM